MISYENCSTPKHTPPLLCKRTICDVVVPRGVLRDRAANAKEDVFIGAKLNPGKLKNNHWQLTLKVLVRTESNIFRLTMNDITLHFIATLNSLVGQLSEMKANIIWNTRYKSCKIRQL